MWCLKPLMRTVADNKHNPAIQTRLRVSIPLLQKLGAVGHQISASITRNFGNERSFRNARWGMRGTDGPDAIPRGRRQGTDPTKSCHPGCRLARALRWLLGEILSNLTYRKIKNSFRRDDSSRSAHLQFLASR